VAGASTVTFRERGLPIALKCASVAREISFKGAHPVNGAELMVAALEN